MAELDKAIGDMKEDGTLAKLVKTYIDDLQRDAEPPAVAMPETGGSVLQIAVTGDLPPLDLVLPDGKAAEKTAKIMGSVGIL